MGSSEKVQCLDDTAEFPCTIDHNASVTDAKPTAQSESTNVPTSQASESELFSTLNIWVLADHATRGTYITEFKISTTVLGFGSETFRRAFKSKEPEEDLPSPISWIESQAPSVVVFRQKGGSFGLGLRAPSDRIVLAWKDEITNAIRVVLDILHLRVDHECSLEPWELAFVAEVAFALDCVTNVLPWLNMWLPLVMESYEYWIWKRSYGSTHDFVCGIVSFVLGDASCFKRTTYAWISNFSSQTPGNNLPWSLVVFPMVKDSIFERREIFTNSLLGVLNDYFTVLSLKELGTDARKDYDMLLGVFMAKLYPYLGNELNLKGKSFTWNGTLSRLSHNIMLPMIDVLSEAALEDGTKSSICDSFEANLIHVVQKFKGLDLQDYRKGAKKLLDVARLLPFSPP